MLERFRAMRRTRTVLAVFVLLFGAAAAGLAAMLGHCSAFGGRCPATAPPLWEDDVFGTVASIVGVTLFCTGLLLRPTRGGLVRAVAAAAIGGPLLGLIARSAALG